MNMYLDGAGAEAELAHWKALADQRRRRDEEFARQMERNAVGYQVEVTAGSSD